MAARGSSKLLSAFHPVARWSCACPGWAAGPLSAGSSRPPHQPEAEPAEIGNDQPVAEAFRQPLHEVGLFVGANLDRVAGFHRKGSVRRDSIVEDRTGEHCRRR